MILRRITLTLIPAPVSSQPTGPQAADATTPLLPQPEHASPQSLRAPLQHVLQVFLSTFATVFLAELGDKTQVTTLLMSAESHSPWIVFAGAACALVLTSLLGVLVGQWLSHKIAPNTLQKAAGACLLLIACGLFWDALGHISGS